MREKILSLLGMGTTEQRKWQAGPKGYQKTTLWELKQFDKYKRE